MPKAGESFKIFVLDQLAGFRGVEARPMFGGWGLYAGGVFFGMVWKGGAFLRVDEESVAEFRARGAKPFDPLKGRPMKNYFAVPVDVLEDADQFTVWSRRALAASKVARTPRTRKASKRSAR
ncbi:MAG: TfoX/Sxy family protein [Planctomycetota bacterium]